MNISFVFGIFIFDTLGLRHKLHTETRFVAMGNESGMSGEQSPLVVVIFCWTERRIFWVGTAIVSFMLTVAIGC